MARSVITLPTCAHCGKALPQRAGRGRPRRYCSDRCRYAAKNARPRRPSWHAGERLAAIPPDPLTLHRRSLELLAEHLEGQPAAPPEVQLAQAITEAHQLRWVFARLADELHINLQWRAAGFAGGLRELLAEWFPGVE